MTHDSTWRTAVLFTLALVLAGCPSPQPSGDDDDDDSTAGDDDTTPGDDDDTTAGDDDTTVGDDDTTVGDDDTAADDDDAQMTGTVVTEESVGYVHRQQLEGAALANGCPGCEFSFTIQYVTVVQNGTCFFCWDLADGVHQLGYDANYLYGGYGPYEIIFYNYQGMGWYLWYMAYGNYGGHDVAFFWVDDYYGYDFYQYGYWDLGAVVDADGDGWSEMQDCDDGDPNINPGATEVCDGVDNDCDPATDENADLDGDGYSVICDADCDDYEPDTHPGEAEACDGDDNDCDGAVPVDETDADGDNVFPCQGDCDDGDPAVRPGAPEVCDGVDNDCDPATDENADLDGDGQSLCGGDCDEADPSVFAGAPELCDGIDNDCDGAPMGTELDLDGDGSLACAGDCDDGNASVYPGATEVCDGVDNDCNAAVDEGCATGLSGLATTTETGYFHEQTLVGFAAGTNCLGCDYTFDIIYTTTVQGGSCLFCWDFADGSYTLGYDSDYMYGGYGPYQVVFYNYGGAGWYIWYMAYPNQGGHDLVFTWEDNYYGTFFYQYGYWDL